MPRICINIHQICILLERPDFPCTRLLFVFGMVLPKIRETPAGVNLQGLWRKEERFLILQTLAKLVPTLSSFGSRADLSRLTSDSASHCLHTIDTLHTLTLEMSQGTPGCFWVAMVKRESIEVSFFRLCAYSFRFRSIPLDTARIFSPSPASCLASRESIRSNLWTFRKSS